METAVLRTDSVFPGISLQYHDLHVPHLVSHSEQTERILEIDHCRDGGMECRALGYTAYLTPGDLSLHWHGIQEQRFPTGHYHGITIQIDLDHTPQCLTCLLEDVDVMPALLAEKFHLKEQFFFVLRQFPAMDHLFAALYAPPPTVRKGYCKVKLLELLLFLTALPPEEQPVRRFSQTQSILADNIHSYLLEHIDQHLPVQELAKQFHVSVSQINTVFHNVYGMSIAHYIRAQRMQIAAQFLRRTDRTVLDIAGQVGYENGSKFAKAFRTVMGVSPAQYRSGLCRKT